MANLIFCTDVSKEFTFQYPVTKTTIRNCRVQTSCAGMLTIVGKAKPSPRSRRTDDLSEQYEVTISAIRFNDGGDILPLLEALDTRYVFPFYDEMMEAVYNHVDWLYNYDDPRIYDSSEVMN